MVMSSYPPALTTLVAAATTCSREIDPHGARWPDRLGIAASLACAREGTPAMVPEIAY